MVARQTSDYGEPEFHRFINSPFRNRGIGSVLMEVEKAFPRLIQHGYIDGLLIVFGRVDDLVHE